MPKETKKAFRHSSTFYRKRARILQNMQENTMENTNASVPASVLPSIIEIVQEQVHEVTPELPHVTLQEPDPPCRGSVSVEPMTDFNEVFSTNLFDEDDHLQIDDEDKSEDEENTHENLREDLKKYFIENSIPHTNANKLLEILRSNQIGGLPKDVRTLIRTPKSIDIQSLGSGEFWYYGIENWLKMVEIPDDVQELKLNFHIDGLPVGKSTKNQFWPILMNIANVSELSQKCFVVSIYFGNSKPETAELFLSQFIEEWLKLLETGIKNVEDKKLSIKINAFICDTPARAFIKCIVSHNAYHSCTKCIVKGFYDKKGRHISFPQTDCVRQSDTSFRNKAYPEHHQKDKTTNQVISSPLERLPIDMIKDFVVADSLHLIDIGLTKKCLNGWVNGSYNFKEKFFIPQVKIINDWLQETNKMMPRDIHRAIRGLDCLSFWKGTEYRTFLLYLGPVILRNFLSQEAYNHFMLLFCSVTILSSNFYISKPSFLKTAEKMLEDYIEIFVSLYGEDAISSNVHNLCHIVDDVKRFGCLSEISTYKFENELGKIKNLLRSGNRPLAQVAKRTMENTYIKNECQEKPTVVFKRPKDKEGHFDILILNNIVFRSNSKDQWFLTKNKKVIKMLSACDLQKDKKILGCSVKNLENFFIYPFESTKLNILTSSKIDFNDGEYFSFFQIKCKLIQLECNLKLIFFPLNHTLDIFDKKNP